MYEVNKTWIPKGVRLVNQLGKVWAIGPRYFDLPTVLYGSAFFSFWFVLRTKLGFLISLI